MHFLALLILLVSTAAQMAAASDELDRALGQMQRLVVPSTTSLLAAEAAEGHWTFVNGRGEKLTVATSAEMYRMPAILTPEVGGPDRKLVIVLTESSAFAGPSSLALLPKDAAVKLSSATGIYDFTTGAPARVRVSPHIDIKIADRAGFQEIVRQLDRSLTRGGLRVISLDPAAQASLAPRPLPDAKRSELVERLDSLRLKDAIGTLRGQTVLITGRVEGKLLYAQASSGPDRSIIINDIVEAAAGAEANLIILETSSGRQPGSRNWLWQRSEVKGFNTLPVDAGLDALLEIIAGDGPPLALSVSETTTNRVTMLGVSEPTNISGSIGSRLSRAAADLTNNMTGKIEPTSIRMHLVSSERQRELDRRLVRWLPSWAAWGYLVLVALGTAASPLAWRWWGRLWPPEQQSDYPGRVGLQLARAARLLIFVLIFTPLVALAAAPVALLKGLRNGLPKAA